MFTPPPSPLPLPRIVITDDDSESSAEKEVNVFELSLSPPSASSRGHSDQDEKHMHATQAATIEAIIYSHERKQRSARRMRWAVLLVPAVLILVALSLRRASMFDVMDGMDLDSRVAMDGLNSATAADSESGTSPEVEIRWQGAPVEQRYDQMYHHKRQTLSLTNPAAPSSTILVTTPLALISGSGALSQTASPTTTVPQTEQTIPPVPDSSNLPPLPTPFPQPYDSTGTNFVTTQTCANFFTNMTQSSAFRTCRPFSLLEQFSNDFTEAQENLTTLNALIYGTCNTDTLLSTCTANMNWFASSLTTSCSDEIKIKNIPVQQTLLGLQSYELLRNGSCLVNQASNTYCYAAAAHSSSPADLYLYQLPLGVAFPVNTTSPSCSTCAKTLLELYADALQGSDGSSDGSGDGGSVDGLKATYEDAANQAESACGTGYALVGLASSAQGTRIGVLRMGMGRGMVLALMVWVLVEVLVWL